MTLYKTTKELVDDCVASFLACCDSALCQARGEAFGYDGMSGEQAQQNARLAWSGMSRAKLFVVNPEQFSAVLRAACRHVQGLAGLDAVVMEDIARRTLAAEKRGDEAELARLRAEVHKHFGSGDEIQEKLISVWEEYGYDAPFPADLPFDACFFAYGRRLHLKPGSEQLWHRIRDRSVERSCDLFLVGHLLAWEGDVPFAFSFIEFRVDEKTSHIGVIRTYLDTWDQPGTYDPWTMSMLVRSINAHKQIVQDYKPTWGHRLNRKEASKPVKQLLPLPAPFYVLNLKDELIVGPMQRARKPGPAKNVEWSYRWDVRGHECVRVERGEMPIPTDDLIRLKKRNYRIYEGMSISREDAERLLRRGVRAPGPREWIAILAYWRDAHVKGPADKPYIPAARVGV